MKHVYTHNKWLTCINRLQTCVLICKKKLQHILVPWSSSQQPTNLDNHSPHRDASAQSKLRTAHCRRLASHQHSSIVRNFIYFLCAHHNQEGIPIESETWPAGRIFQFAIAFFFLPHSTLLKTCLLSVACCSGVRCAQFYASGAEKEAETVAPKVIVKPRQGGGSNCLV